jgi:hypothetical protein
VVITLCRNDRQARPRNGDCHGDNPTTTSADTPLSLCGEPRSLVRLMPGIRLCVIGIAVLGIALEMDRSAGGWASER